MDPIKLLLSGDFAPLISLNKINDNHFTEFSEIFATVDLHITNLESPLTLSQKNIEKSGPSIKSDPASIVLLQQARVNVACLANNHIFDYGEEGILDTIKLCEKQGLETIGITSRKDGRDAWLIKNIKGRKIGFLNYCEHEFSVREPGLLGTCGYDAVNAFYDIQKLKLLVDYLIVIYHGGNEYYPLPNPELKKDFHYLADLGADAVFGHHTHVYSGCEMYKGKPLVYSLGNFFFPYPDEPVEWHQGLLCMLEIGKAVNIKIYPIIQCLNDYNVTFATKELQASILQVIENYSEIISNEEELKNYWKIFSDKNRAGMEKFFLYPCILEKLLLKAGLLNKKKYRDRAKAITNILRCKSLSRLTIDSLKLNSKL